MTAIKPAIIKDSIELINLYKKNPAFRERFDAAIRRSVDVTYKHRPLKLYFEVLASTNPKYKDEYHKIQRLVRHDSEDIIKNTLLAVTQADLNNLNSHAEKAEKKINTTAYPDEEIEKINKAENETESLEQKYKAHKNRLEETSYLAAVKTPVVIEEVKEKKPEEIEELLIPGATPQLKKSYQPATLEEKARLEAALNQPRPEVPVGVLVGPGGEPIRNIYQERTIEPIQELTEEKPEARIIPSAPQPPSIRTITRTREFITSPTTFIKKTFRGGEARIAAGRTVISGLGRTAIKAGASTVARAGAGIIARLGISTILSTVFGVATGGIGFVIGMLITLISLIVTTFSKQIKQAFRIILWATVGIIAFMIFMFFGNWGMKMNSLLPPYDIAEAAPPTETPSVSPSPIPTGTITPSPTPGADTASCPLYSSGGISCGSYGSNYSGCPGGHCSDSYNAGLPPASQCLPSDSRLPHSIDVSAAAGTLVYLPTINGQSTTWIFSGANSVTEGAGGGQRFMFTAHVGNNDWLLYLTHVSPSSTSLSVGSSYLSGTAVATIYSNQLHINIAKKTPSDSDAIWINPESLGMCI